jgi:hypothetical protein
MAVKESLKRLLLHLYLLPIISIISRYPTFLNVTIKKYYNKSMKFTTKIKLTLVLQLSCRMATDHLQFRNNAVC